MTDNPQAFPCLDSSGYGLSMRDPGMTLRDYYAGQALANPAICDGNPGKWVLEKWFGDRGGIMPGEIVARQAGEYADAMLTERTKHND
jgi:hypothetical protein